MSDYPKLDRRRKRHVTAEVRRMREDEALNYIEHAYLPIEPDGDEPHESGPWTNDGDDDDDDATLPAPADSGPGSA